MGIILLPLPDNRSRYSKVLRRHYVCWAENQFPNPFKTRDGDLIDKVHTLHARLLLFIEDYLTKATAIFPPREHLCLPDLSPNGTHLMFKGEAVSPRFDATQLTDAERQRLLAAFLRYEMMCVIRHQGASFMARWNFPHSITGFVAEWDPGELFKHKGQRLGPLRRETILCVHQYIRSLYAAMFAQCSDSWLPDIPVSSPYSYNTGLLYPDTLYVNACAYASDMGLPPNEALHPISIEAAGFDLVSVLIRSAMAGQDGRDHLRSWFKRFFENTRMNSRSSVSSLHYGYGDLETGEVRDTHREEDPGMYQTLCSLFTANLSLHSDIYRQRAWAFFDDDRFYPSSGAGPHFPDPMEMREQWGSTEDDVEWFSDPKQVRARHRSQKWHDELLGKPRGNEEVKESQNTGVETLLPVISERYWFRRLPRFWY
ncbi:hypothetical protein LCI18_003400 [Fusarium solani-melongenae]|uniref:Uncharacterized protein n=1 Tax=Fusarium solani subsp. cucurbitae TaxID=2747967 RepID=A0ACD3YU67_FUSSC|nr:hypothetical protein LCI18_003400 [Fusarium solani-melongenae]